MVTSDQHHGCEGCSIRSIDYVAAYLQGKFVDGEVVFCRMPPGFEEIDKKTGKPFILRIEKPIYGIPQAGRRLQRQVVPWMKRQGLVQLDGALKDPPAKYLGNNVA